MKTTAKITLCALLLLAAGCAHRTAPVKAAPAIYPLPAPMLGATDIHVVTAHGNAILRAIGATP